MDPSLIPNYNKWIKQFAPEDKYYAKELVESLIYITHDNFINSMKEDLLNYIKTLTGNIALFAVRDILSSEVDYFPNYSEKPLKINNNQGVGSPGEITHFIRDFRKKYNENDNLFDHPSLQSMKVNKVRNIIFINDIGASGTQIYDFFKFFFRNKTIKSWWSSKLISFHVYSHNLSSQGMHTLVYYNKYIPRNNIFYNIHASYGAKDWDLKKRQKIENICLKYGNLIDPEKALGYKDSFSLYIYSHKCPNNVPIIIWGEKENVWIPLMYTRPNFEISSSFIGSYQFIYTLYAKLKIYVKKNSYILRSDTKKSILILKYLSKFRGNQDSVKKFLDLNNFQWDYYIKELKQFNWLDPYEKITEQGYLVLKKINKRKKERTKIDIEENYDFYYPSSLQAPNY